MAWLTEQRLTYFALFLSIILNAFLAAGWIVEHRTIGFILWQRSAEQAIQRIATDVEQLKKQPKAAQPGG